MRYLPLVALTLSMSVLCSCHSQSEVSGTTAGTVATSALGSENAPTDKEIIYMVMQLHEVPLKVHPSCEGMGMDFDDTTIGQFLSGFWAYQTEPEEDTYLKIDVVAGDASDGIERWKATLLIGGTTEETPYQVGISFNILAADMEVETQSIRCLGAG